MSTGWLLPLDLWFCWSHAFSSSRSGNPEVFPTMSCFCRVNLLPIKETSRHLSIKLHRIQHFFFLLAVAKVYNLQVLPNSNLLAKYYLVVVRNLSLVRLEFQFCHISSGPWILIMLCPDFLICRMEIAAL